jgi:hypothetical protein
MNQLAIAQPSAKVAYRINRRPQDIGIDIARSIRVETADLLSL